MKLLSLPGLALAALLVPLVLLYILKVQRRRVRVASTWLWSEVARDLAARSPWKRLVVQLPLLVQALVLLALAFGAARPVTTGQRVTGEHVAIVVDTSASMGAQEGDATRLELARRIGHELVDSLAPGSDAMILDAAREPRIAMSPDRDVRRMHAALDALSVHEVEGDLAASVSLASARLGALTGARRIFVISDGALARPGALRGAVPVEVIKVGSPKDNTGIVRVDVRRGRDPVLDRDEVQAFLMVANPSDRARDVFVTMKQRGASDTLASRKLTLAPGERSPVVLTFAPAPGDRGAGLVFELSPHDALLADDVAYARVPFGRDLPVVLASKEPRSPWLERVLASDADATVTRGPIELDPESVPDQAFVVVEGACPANIPGGDVWIVDPPPGRCFDVEVGDEVARPALTSWDDADPRMRFLSLDDVFIERAHTLTPASRRQSLVRGSSGALVVDASTATRKVTIVGFDVASSDWPYKASFVVFARNLMEEARQQRASAFIGATTTGEALRVRVPLGVSSVEVSAPGDESGEPRRLDVRGGMAVVPDADRAGFYRVAWASPSPGAHLVPVNLASAEESDLRRTLPEDSGADTVVEGTPSAMAPREHAHLLALVALGLVAFDVWYLTRKPRRALPRTPLVRGGAS